VVDTFRIRNIRFGDLETEDIHEILKDGRLASHFLERQLEIWYPHLTFVDGRGHDHIDEEGNLYDQKCFTKGGLAFAPSNMIGGSRSINEEVATEHCKKIIYICCDIIDFPTVRVKFAKGSDLMKEYKNFKIPKSQRENFFSK
jgi:hypothetical protein